MSTAHAILPPLRDGERLTREEFLRRWEALPGLKRAELIDGVVHLPSPVSTYHSKDSCWMTGWIFTYSLQTPGCDGGVAGTWLMGPEDDAPQPDVTLCILPEYGGQSRVEKGLAAGAPELIVEVCYSSKAYDLGLKLKLYEQSGVPEYITWLVPERQIVWRRLVAGKYRMIAPDLDGILRSRVFPGLWLDPDAMLAGDKTRVIQVVQQGMASPEHAEFVRRLNAAKQDSD